MKKREADFTITFRHYLKANPLKSSCAFEVKQTITDSIPFSSVKEHQIDALLATKYSGSGFLYKIGDDSRGIKPYDLVYFKDAPAFIVIKYPTRFHIIDIDTFLLEKEKSKRKSLTDQRAEEIAWKTVNLKKHLA